MKSRHRSAGSPAFTLRSTPTGRIRSETEPASSDLARKDSNMESDSGYSRSAENVGESKIINGLVGRMVSKLPCNSGMRLESMANDITILTSVQSLRQLATLRLSTVVNSLAGALEALAKYSINKSHADVPLELHQSQAYLLYLLDSCLTVTWRQRADADPSQSSDIPRFWPDPPQLDESSARTLLNVLVTYLRFVSSENSLHSGTASPATSRDGRGQSSSMVSWGHGVVEQPGFSALSPAFIQTHQQNNHNLSHSHEAELLACTNMSNIVDTVTQTTRYLGQTIFFLSSSNWNLVFTRVRSRLAHLTTTIEDTPDLIELRLLQWANLDRVRLGQLMQETSNVFIHIKRPSQIAFASVLHSAIWNWIDCNPDEFDSLVGSERRIDGNPEGLFDVLYSMSDFSSSNVKRTAVFYPLLAMILVICPDLFKKVVMGDSGKSSGLSKKFSFMESLKKGLSGHKGFEPSAACYVDYVKAAMRVSPRHSNSALRSLLPQVLHDLKDALFFGSHSNDLVDSGLPVDGLVAMYCADPAHIGSTVFNRLWLDSDISRATAVKACSKIVAEGDSLPWLPPAAGLRQEVAGSVRQVFKAAVGNYLSDRGSSKRPRMSTEASPSLADLLTDILKLYEQDPQFALASTARGDFRVGDHVDQVVPLISTLLVGTGSDSLRIHAKSALLAILDRLTTELSAGVGYEISTSTMWPAIWQAMTDASRQVLFAFDSGDSEDLVIACTNLWQIISAVSRLAKAAMLSLPTRGIESAVLVTTVATAFSLARSAVEQQSSASAVLLALRDIVRIAFDSAPQFGGESRDESRHQAGIRIANLLDELARLPHATGRQQQQRQFRRVLRTHAQSSIVMSAIWTGLNHRLKSLMGKMGRFSPETSFVDLGASSRALDAAALADGESKEWQNLYALLASSASCASDIPQKASLGDIVGAGQLPRLYDDVVDISAEVNTFISNSVNMLFSGSVFIRESVKEALGNELSLTLGRTLVSTMMSLLVRCVGPNGIIVSGPFTVLVEQSIAVLRLTMDRVQPGTRLDLSEIMFYFARYLSRLGRDEAALRIKMRFCYLAELVLSKEETASTGHDTVLRNALLDWLTEWSVDTMKDLDSYSSPHGHGERGRTQKDLDHACLRTLVVITNGLVLRSTTETSEETPIAVRARLFQKYLALLIKALERAAVSDDTSVRRRTTTADSQMNNPATETSSSLAIAALSNLLSANMDVGLKHCLTLGYHEDPLLRSAFLQLTSSILRTATPFGGLDIQSTQSNQPKPFLDALVSDNLAFAVAICEVCPVPEVDEMLGLLFRSMEAKGTLMGLVKVMLEKEVAQTNHESELFRANSITTKMLTIFGKTFGYNYVRSTLHPLIHNMVEKPAACSFELDPSKAGPNEDIDKNADHLRLICQALLDMICTSTTRAPVMFRALCHQIWEIVEDRFPEARHSAIGSFIFLRFFCPAIVTPEAVDLDIPSESREIRRALLLITKVIQNLANNVKFKEPHMQILNTFLAENIKQVTRFLSDIAMRPRSWELAQVVKQNADETEKSQDRDVDNEILHAFVYKHYSRLQPVLESMPPSYRRSITPRSARADIDGSAALKVIIDLMRTTGEPVEATALNAAAKSQAYDDLMRQNAGRDTSGLKSVFVEGPLSQNGRRIFYFIFSGLNLVDYDLLAYHIFKTMEEVTETFDFIFDFTGYTPAVDIPKFWIQRIAQLCPTRLLMLVNCLALYNVNTYATKRVRRIVGVLAPICGPVGKQVITSCSPSELGESIPFTNLGLPDFTMNLAFEADHVFTNLLKLSTHEAQMPVVVKLGLTCLQVASWGKFPLTSSLKAYIVDTIKLNEIDDLVTGSGDTEDHLTVTYRQTSSITFVSKKRNEMAHLIRTARSRLRDTPSEERALRPRDVPGTLLNIALLNLSASDETLRTGAYNLFNDLGKFYDYDMFQGVRKVTAGMTLPANSLAFVFGLSRTLAKNAPYLTLEFLKEWTIGFGRADVAQKTACLQYVGPWISNLEAFASPSRDDAEESCKQVAEIIRSLIAITGFEKKRLQLVIQEHVWARLAEKNEHITDIVLTELVDAAMGGGMGSERAECVAEILHVISTTAIRGQLIARLRKTIAQTYLKPSAMLDQNPAWNEICVLARINLMLSFTPANPLGAQLFLPELIHIITLLVGIGPTMVRQTIYGLFINLLQSMASSKATDEMNATTLQHALEKAQTPLIMCCFGLVQLGSGLETLEERSSKEDAENSRLDRVEVLAGFMGEILVAAAPSPDCANAWRARWMGLVVGTCFQHNPATQPQAFTILGYLASDEVDDDLVYQVLVAMSTTLSHLSDTDTTLLTSMLRCLSRIIPGLLPDSRYATSLFWLAFAVVEMGYIPLFGPALELMHTALKALDGDERVDRVMDHLFEFRQSMGEPARKIDQIAGISFDQEPSFGIIGILFKGFRHPSTRKAAIGVALELLKLTTHHTAHHTGPVPEDEAALIPKSSVAYFVALLPVLAGDVDELKNLFIAAGLEVKDESLMDLSTLSVLSVLSIPDNSSAIFVVTIIVTVLNSAPSDAERLILYRLLADASSEMPEVLSMAYDSLIPRLSTTINTSSHPALIHNATVVLSRALADTAYTFPSSGPLVNDSQTSLQQSFKGSISSLNGGGNGGAMIAVLDDLGMKGLGEGGFAPVKMDRLAMMAKWVAALIDSFTL